MSKKSFVTAAVLCLVLFVAGCNAGKAPAEAAIQAAESALGAAQGEASKFVPDQLKELQDSLAGAKDAFAKGDFKGALASAQSLPAGIASLKEAALAKKAEFEKSWADMASGFPQVVEAIRGRVDILSQAKSLPQGMTAEQLETAKSSLGDVVQKWTDASSAAASGDVVAAVAKAAPLKGQAVEVMTALGMEVPEALR